MSNPARRSLWLLLFLIALGGAGYAAYRAYWRTPVDRRSWSERGFEEGWLVQGRPGGRGSFGTILLFKPGKDPKPGEDLKPVRAFAASKEVTDDDLRDLPQINEPFVVHLNDSKVTDVGLRRLAGCKNLRAILLHPTQVSDATLAALREIGLLHTFSIGGSRHPLNGPRPMDPSEWPQRPADARIMNLSGTAVTDAGLANLAALENLVELHLENTQVTDAGLEQLARMKSLKTINLRSSRATPEGVNKLREALPGCQVIS